MEIKTETIDREMEAMRDRIERKVLVYGEKHIRDKDNVIAMEILFEIDKEVDHLKKELGLGNLSLDSILDKVSN